MCREGLPRHDSDVGSQSLRPIKTCFKEWLGFEIGEWAISANTQPGRKASFPLFAFKPKARRAAESRISNF
jgi:hypothetical protein